MLNYIIGMREDVDNRLELGDKKNNSLGNLEDFILNNLDVMIGLQAITLW